MVSQANSTVLLTGATGFLGSKLLRGMLEQQRTVIVLKRSWSDTWRIRDLLPHAIVYDIDLVPLRDMFSSHAIDFVIHAATSYGRKGEMGSQIIESNLLFPVRLFELCGEFGVDTFFNIDTFFNTNTSLPGGLNEYVLSKKSFIEFVGRSEYRQKLRFANIRLEHMYGPGDDEKKFVPYILKNLLDNTQSIDLTGGEQCRDFIYVDDVANAILALLDHHSELPQPEVQIGLGTGESISLRTFLELACKVCNSSSKLNFGKLPYRAGEIMESHADISILKKLGWTPKMSLSDGIKQTIKQMREQQ